MKPLPTVPTKGEASLGIINRGFSPLKGVGGDGAQITNNHPFGFYGERILPDGGRYSHFTSFEAAAAVIVYEPQKKILRWFEGKHRFPYSTRILLIEEVRLPGENPKIKTPGGFCRNRGFIQTLKDELLSDAQIRLSEDIDWSLVPWMWDIGYYPMIDTRIINFYISKDHVDIAVITKAKVFTLGELRKKITADAQRRFGERQIDDGAVVSAVSSLLM